MKLRLCRRQAGERIQRATAVGRSRREPQRSESQESTCGWNRCNNLSSPRGFATEVNLWNARPFHPHPSGWYGMIESIREADARKGWLFVARIKALKG
jgi:hypothetical protein